MSKLDRYRFTKHAVLRGAAMIPVADGDWVRHEDVVDMLTTIKKSFDYAGLDDSWWFIDRINEALDKLK